MAERASIKQENELKERSFSNVHCASAAETCALFIGCVLSVFRENKFKCSVRFLEKKIVFFRKELVSRYYFDVSTKISVYMHIFI